MNKILLPLLAAALITGCAGGGITSIQAHKLATVLDFTPFTKRGFLFTPEPYQGDYESVGLITVSISASGDRKRLRPGIYDWDWDLSQVQADSVLNYFYEKATALGADAVIRFSLTHSNTDFAGLQVPTTIASGFAIKRTRK